MRVLVTGATGFVGRRLCQRLSDDGFAVVAGVRTAGTGAPLREVVLGNIGSDEVPGAALNDIDAVVHLAARVHVMSDEANDPLAEFRRVNTVGTEMLAAAAATAGVRRFVHVSTIKVLGERTDNSPFTHASLPAPVDPYAISKFEAEEALAEIAAHSIMEVVVLRPPLVYGPFVGGNVLRAFKLVDRGYPLPIGSIRNKRSMLGVSNLCDVIMKSLTHPQAAGERLLVADTSDLSTKKHG
jgi:nucleoside-diphosphate-sugar epimerase